jgi:Uma2 family endonuclease
MSHLLRLQLRDELPVNLTLLVVLYLSPPGNTRPSAWQGAGGFMTPDREPVSIYDWAVTANLQPEPISVEVWRNLPEEFCRQVELVNGQVVRCDKPSRAHQAAATRIAAMLDAAAEAHMERNPGTCLDTSSDFDVLLWEVPAATIRSPDAALFDCAPNDLRPLPASHMKVVVEVVSPGSRKADKLDKMAEYADAGIPFYWLVWLSDDHVLSIDIHVLDHTLGYYRLHRTLTPEQEISTVDVPIRIQVNWNSLAHLIRQ